MSDDTERSFDLAIGLGGREHVFKLFVEDIRARRSPALRATIARGKADGDERLGLRTAAFDIVRSWVDPTDRHDGTQPLTIVQDGDAWVIPIAAITYIRLSDPSAPSDSKAFGFVRPPADE